MCEDGSTANRAITLDDDSDDDISGGGVRGSATAATAAVLANPAPPPSFGPWSNWALANLPRPNPPLSHSQASLHLDDSSDSSSDSSDSSDSDSSDSLYVPPERASAASRRRKPARMTPTWRRSQPTRH